MGALVNDKSVYQQAAAATAHAQAGAAAFQENMEALKHNFFLRGFFKRRGYDSSNELKRYQISQLPPEPHIKRFVYEAPQIFDKPDTAKLKNQRVLNQAGKFLEDNPFGFAVVAAYAGMKGDTDKNRLLTQARAMVVRDYLAHNFRLEDTRLRTIGLGENKETGDGGKVEIVIYPVGSSVPPPQNQFPAGY